MRQPSFGVGNLANSKAIEPYCDEDHIRIKTIGHIQILEIEINEEEGYDEWVNERGLLSTLARLRGDILQGDYRALYLAWLRAMSLASDDYDENEDDPENFFNDPEPPLPTSLRLTRF